MPTVEAPPPTLAVIAYGPDRLTEERLGSAAELDRLPVEAGVTWFDVQGLGDLDVIRSIGERFGLHPLTIADIVHVNQRPKLEIYDDHLFIVVRMPHLDHRLGFEQLSLVVGRGFVLSFQERPGDRFDPVRERLRRARRGAFAAAAPTISPTPCSMP